MLSMPSGLTYNSGFRFVEILLLLICNSKTRVNIEFLNSERLNVARLSPRLSIKQKLSFIENSIPVRYNAFF